MRRRELFAAAPAVFVGAVSGAISTTASPSIELGTILAVLDDLESWQGWEPANVVCAKAYAAVRLRQAAGLDLPESALSLARDHLCYQNEDWQRYSQSYWFAQDQAQGKNYTPPPRASSI